jgi:hypothetical protein
MALSRESAMRSSVATCIWCEKVAEESAVSQHLVAVCCPGAKHGVLNTWKLQSSGRVTGPLGPSQLTLFTAAGEWLMKRVLLLDALATSFTLSKYCGTNQHVQKCGFCRYVRVPVAES